MKALTAALLLATPAAATNPVTDWADLHERCTASVSAGAVLETDGLVERPPDVVAEIVDEAPFGLRIDVVPLRTSARTVPTGIWTRPNGRFELRLLEFPAPPGSRAICEVFVRRGAQALAEREAADVFDAFEAAHEGVTRTEDRRVAVLSQTSPRGCKVIASVTARDGFFRSSVAEAVGRPECGGPSLSGAGGRNPARVMEGERDAGR